MDAGSTTGTRGQATQHGKNHKVNAAQSYTQREHSTASAEMFSLAQAGSIRDKHRPQRLRRREGAKLRTRKTGMQLPTARWAPQLVCKWQMRQWTMTATRQLANLWRYILMTNAPSVSPFEHRIPTRSSHRRYTDPDINSVQTYQRHTGPRKRHSH